MSGTAQPNGIAATASYLPCNVLTRAAAAQAWPRAGMSVQSRTVPSVDEDPITMGAHAALLALDRAGVQGSDLSGVLFATVSSPYVVKSAAAVLADYLNAARSVCLFDFGAGTHAGLLALVTALRDEQLAARGPLLVVAADALFAHPSDARDLSLGAGASAFLVAPGGFATLESFDHRYSSHTSTWQVPGESYLRRYEDERFDRAAGYAAQMVAGLQAFVSGLDSAPDWYALHLSGGADDERVVAAASSGAGGGRAEPGRERGASGRVAGREVVRRTGDTGCANVLLSLSDALERAGRGDAVLAQSFGSGAGTVTALLRVGGGTQRPDAGSHVVDRATVELSYTQYAKSRRILPLADMPSAGPPFAASPPWERAKAASVGLVGVRCESCGSLNFPRRQYCLDCRGQLLHPVELPRTATVLTYNLQHIVAISPEEAPQPICTALLDGEEPGRYGGKVAALITDTRLDRVRVGMPVELVPRRGDVDDGLVSYGWKFRPIAEGE